MGSPFGLSRLLLAVLQTTTISLLLHWSSKFSQVSGYPSSSILANQLPRFNIPGGNLSYFRSPYWEVLYLLKFKTLPFHSTTSSSSNGPLLQRIKSFLGSDSFSYPTHNEESDNSNFFLYSGDSTTATDFEPEPEVTAKTLKPLESTGQLSQKKKYSRKRKLVKKFKVPILEPNLMDEYDNGFFIRKLNRIAKQTGENYDNNRRTGTVFGDSDSLGGEIASETTINRKVNRKFQTQGWK